MVEFKFPNVPTQKTAVEVNYPRLKGDVSNEVILGFPNSPSLILPVATVPLVSKLPPFFITVHDYEFTANSVQKGRLYVNTAITAASTKGLVLLCHGAIFKEAHKTDLLYKDAFDSLARCLASSGFVAVSMRHSSLDNTGSVGAEISFIKHTIFLLTDPGFTAKFLLKGKPLVFIGHSEGGLGAAKAAKSITNILLPNLVTSVSAIIGLAPKVDINDLLDGHADSMLILQGTHDGDTTSQAGSLPAYEAAGKVPFRSFIWIHGGNHARFIEKTSGVDPQPFSEDVGSMISRETQMLITQNYVTSFLQWRIAGDATRSRPFLGDGLFDFKSSSDPFVQDDIMKWRLRVFPRYAATASSLCAIGALTFQDILQQDGKLISGSNPAQFSALTNFAPSLHPQRTYGFRIQWKRSQFANPQISIPLHGVNASSMFIEFDTTMMANFPIPILLPTFLRLTKNGTTSVSKSVDIRMPAPLIMKGPGNTRSLVSTVRIPISIYGAASDSVNKSTKLVLDFKSVGSSIGDMAFSAFSVRSE